MRFRFKLSDETVEAGFRRVAIETLDDALGLLRDRDLPTAQIVHRLRRHCKAMRGLLRLVRPVFPAYQAENAIFRNVAASLSAARDHVVLVEALDSLIAEAEKSRRSHPTLEPGLITAIRDRLAKPAGDPAQLDQAADILLAARVRAANWALVGHGHPQLAPGFSKTYRSARRLMAMLDDTGEPQLSHEWRKQVKYHWQHMRLLRTIAPDLTRNRVRAAGRLGDLLGEQHDLDLLTDRLDEAGAIVLADLARHRAARLARRSAKLGLRLFDQRPSVYMKGWARSRSFGPSADAVSPSCDRLACAPMPAHVRRWC